MKVGNLINDQTFSIGIKLDDERTKSKLGKVAAKKLIYDLAVELVLVVRVF